jgi:hypothetical protein
MFPIEEINKGIKLIPTKAETAIAPLRGNGA